MQWCDKENNDFPDSEFTWEGGVRYHTRRGEPHAADGDEVVGDHVLTDAVPEPHPHDPGNR
jgi:hypothetical protein